MIIQKTDRALIVHHNTWNLMIALQVLILIGLISVMFKFQRPILALSVGVVSMLLAVGLSEQFRAVFDVINQRVSWNRRLLFRRRKGSVNFTDIRLIRFENCNAIEGPANYRIVMLTNGEPIYIPRTGILSQHQTYRLFELIKQLMPGVLTESA